MTTKNTYKYTVDLTTLISNRIERKETIKALGNEVYKTNLEIQTNKKSLAKIEKEIDDMVIDFNKK